MAAGGGLKVAKHGNRAAVSSKSGSSDVLAALGVNIAAGPPQQRRALDEAGICFLFAPAHHGAMRHVHADPPGTGFPHDLQYPGAAFQSGRARGGRCSGVFDARWVEPLARVLGALGATGPGSSTATASTR